MNLSSYFLIVWDIASYAKEHGIRYSGRGSAADSLVCYLLGITNVDPIANDLLFERFLNPYRQDLPDIDIDFDSNRRGGSYHTSSGASAWKGPRWYVR